MVKTTIKKELDQLNFDWDSGKIVYQHLKGWGDIFTLPEDKWYARLITDSEDEVVNRAFDADDSLRWPRFIAIDGEYVYFIAFYESDVWLEAIPLDITKFLDYSAFWIYLVGGG